MSLSVTLSRSNLTSYIAFAGTSICRWHYENKFKFWKFEERVISCVEVLRRLTSKCLARLVQQDAVQALSPLQVGVGVKCGCEAIIHSVFSTFSDSNPLPDHCWSLLLDFSNAFNSIDRGFMFEEIRARIPDISAWMECCYGSQPVLHLDDKTILSCCGVQQGDPLGPLGFAVALQPIVERIQREVPNLHINAWYLDDGTMCGSPNDLGEALKIVEEDGLIIQMNCSTPT